MRYDTFDLDYRQPQQQPLIISRSRPGLLKRQKGGVLTLTSAASDRKTRTATEPPDQNARIVSLPLQTSGLMKETLAHWHSSQA